MATAAGGEPTVTMEEHLTKEGEHVDDPAEAMEQAAEERKETGEADEAMEQAEEREEAAEPDEAMEQVEEEEEERVEAGEPAEAVEQIGEELEEAGAEAEAEAEEGASLQPTLPVGRVKRIMRVDRDIKKVTSEAALLIAAATELFLGSLATGAHTAATRRGRRTVRAAHVRAAARAHRPTADFLLDCLPAEEEAPRARPVAGSSGGGGGREAKPLPRGTRRIDAFFQKVT